VKARAAEVVPSPADLADSLWISVRRWERAPVLREWEPHEVVDLVPLAVPVVVFERGEGL
jgi:hypothetical protein